MRLNKYYLRFEASDYIIQKLTDILEAFSFETLKRDGDNYWFVPAVDAELDSSKRYEIAHTEISRLNLLLKAFSGDPDREEGVRLISIVRFRSDGKDNWVELEPITGRADLMSPRATASGIGFVGSAPQKMGENYLTVLSLDQVAMQIANLIYSKEIKQFEFWKAKELLVGKNGDLFSHGLLSKKENEEFKKWANSPEASGGDARHAHPDPSQSSTQNISDEKARAYLLNAFRIWLKKRHNQDIL